MPRETNMTRVLTLQTHKLTDADLHALITVLIDLLNSRRLSDIAGEAVLDMLSDAEADFFQRDSGNAEDALRKVICLADDVIKDNYSHGPQVVADAFAVLAALDRAKKAGVAA